MENKIEETRWQFLFYINKNIICQRFIDIRNYNPDCINSMELKEMCNNIAGMNNNDFGSMGIIPRHLKKKSSEYLWYQFNTNSEDINAIENRVNKENETVFEFEVKVDNQTIIKTSFDGSLIKGRHVDIKEIIPSIVKELRYYMSLQDYTDRYLGQKLYKTSISL